MNEAGTSRMARYGMLGCIVPAIICVLFVASSLIPAMTSTDAERWAGAASAGDRVLRIGWVDMMGEIATLNPLLATTAGEMTLIWPCYSTLLTYDADGKLIGDLARTWSFSADGLVLKLRLYETAVFYDKNNPTLKMPATAKDVIFTYYLVQNQTSNTLSNLLPVVGGKPIIKSMSYGPTDYDLTIELSSTYAPIMSALTWIPILPEYVWKDKAWNWANFGGGVAPCIGSGFLYYSQDGLPTTGTIEMVRSPTWFHTEENGWQLRTNRIVFKSEPSPWYSLNDFQNGNIDIMAWCTPDQYQNSLPYTPGTVVQSVHLGFVYEFNLNQMSDAMRNALGGYWKHGSNNQLLLDPVVKMALAMTVDRQAFIDAVSLGLGAPADSLVPLVHPYHYVYGSDPGDSPVPVNTKWARELLMANGWMYRIDGTEIKLGDPDYWTYYPLCKVGGTSPLSFRFYTLSETPEWDIGGRLLIEWARQAGIDLGSNYQLMTQAQMATAWYYADYDVWLWDWIFSPNSDVSVDILSVLTTMEIGSWSDVFYSNATYDALYNQSLVVVDPSARRVITDEMQRMAYEDHSCQPVSYKPDIFAMRAVAPDNWSNWGDWSQQWVLEPSQCYPWLYVRIEPEDNHAPVVSAPEYLDGMVGDPVLFAASATDESASLEYRWFFGDGSKSDWSQSSSVTHTYSEEGWYYAYVAVREADTLDRFVSVAKVTVLVASDNMAPSGLDFVWEPQTVRAGQPVVFNGTAIDDENDPLVFTWDFGDGTTGVGQGVVHTYKVAGTMNVTMYVDDGHIGIGPRPSTLTKTIEVAPNSPPSISVPDWQKVLNREPYLFSVTYSDPDPGDSARFTWFWGDGSVSVTSEPEAWHTYKFKQLYNLTVFCDDLTGLPGHNVSDWGMVSVTNEPNHPPSITSFSVDNSTPLAGQVVTFACTAVDNDNDPLNFTFEFGDGTFGYVELPGPGTASITHVYQVASIYDAYVYVRDVWSGSTSAGPLELTVSWATFSLALKPGWNLVSVPLLNYGYKASTLGLSTGDMVARWDSATQRYDKTHVVNITPPALTDFDIMPGTGYWIYVAEDTTLLLKGAIPTGQQSHNITVPSGGGWALIGFNTLSSSYHASDVPSMYTNGGISTIVAYRNGKYVQYIKGVPGTDFSILPGEGYWVYCLWSGTLSYKSDPGFIILRAM